MSVKPCDQCKRNKSCESKKFIDKHINKSPWDFESMLRDYTAEVTISKMGIFDGKVEIEIECIQFDNIKEEEDYSGLVDDDRKCIEYGDNSAARRQIAEGLSKRKGFNGI